MSEFPPTDPLYPLFSIFAFFGFLLPLIPLTWHLQTWNSGACFYMIWASLFGLINFVDSIVWAGRVLDVAPVWCDIAVHIYQAGCFAIPLSSLCIIRRLYLVASSKLVLTRLERRRAIIIDTVLCLILPLVLLTLQYISQGHRYDIWEEIGCKWHMYITLTGVLLCNLPIITTGFISAIYAVFCIKALWRLLRKQNYNFISTNASSRSFTSDRYIPIVALAALEMTCTTPFAIFALIINIKQGLQPWISWDYVHSDFSYVGTVPSVIWKSNDVLKISLETERWITASFGIIIFLFLGTTKEARKHYLRAFRRLGRLGGRRATTVTPAGDESHDIPDYSMTEIAYSLPTVVDIHRESEMYFQKNVVGDDSWPLFDITARNYI
ncbi:hypothetical protein GYMLUDRAFT_208084 [Collybiopsis luxurians FD-317 M1]|uniref:Uncharacterized protein n=1 Tax=Collybiopsis luxurians FD-317 M1 TaxID=944289 RepID=A0A0D0BRM0_9AGAR|nr:hypothetical protein GYMLUDRAFT_208084 [Collybiopsis luxurians FD-317 M1]